MKIIKSLLQTGCRMLHEILTEDILLPTIIQLLWIFTDA